MNELKYNITNTKKAYERTLKIAEKWDELSEKQLIAIAPVLLSPGMDQEEAYLKHLFVLSNLSESEFQDLCELLIEEEYNQDCSITDLFPLVEWLYNTELKTSKSLLPRYGKMVGPQTDFNGMTFVQYIVADPLFMDYLEDRSEDVMNRLCAVLYVPNGERFNGDALPWLPKIETVPTDVKEAMILNFMAMRRWFADCFPLLHDGNNEDDADEDDYDPNWGRNLMYELPNEKFGTLDEIRYTNVTVIFDYLEKLKEKSHADEPAVE